MIKYNSDGIISSNFNYASIESKKNSIEPTGNRRLDKLRRAGFFSNQKMGNIFTRATSARDLQKAYKLVHDVFVETKFIIENKSGMRIRPWEANYNTATFVAKTDYKINGVFSLIVDSDDLGLPSDNAFKIEIDSKRKNNKLICELTNQAIVPTFRFSSVPTQLMRCVFAQAWFSNASGLICSISPKQKNFFNLIGFEQVGEVKNYSTIVNDPVILMYLEDIQNRWISFDLDKEPLCEFWRQFFIVENEYINAIEYWNIEAMRTFQNADELIQLFSQCEEMFKSSSRNQLNAMKKRLGFAIDFDYLIH